MIIGDGLIASAFKVYADNDDVLIFASGVSDSSETRNSEFKREMLLLLDAISSNKDKTLVYFSSMDIDHINKHRYMQHKLLMERLIEFYCVRYIILRLPNVLGSGGNKNNLINYFKHRICNNIQINILKGAYKSILDIDDVVYMVYRMIAAGELGLLHFGGIDCISAEDLANMIADALSVKPTINLVDDGHHCNMFNSRSVQRVVYEMDLRNYTRRTVQKYINVL